MAHALERASECSVLSQRPRLGFRHGPYTYQITRQGNQVTYSVTDGSQTISEPLQYCFGEGSVGQTYVFSHKGLWYESRVSFYSTTGGLDITTGQNRQVSTSLEDAIGRPMALDEAQTCFSCHSTAAVKREGLQLDRMIDGVACERCHGPGAEHVTAVKAGHFKDLRIFNPGSLDPVSLSQEFCGACHRSFDQAMLMPGQGGPNNIRFQPYRIFNSSGHNTADPRISCLGCHDPHEKLEHDAAFYDRKCLACHLSSQKDLKTSARSAPACPVKTDGCTTCHMPKVELPQMHFKFTDHWIRVVKPGDPVPR
jgi:hypothetical protein